MFRRLVMAAVTVTGLAALPAAAEAHPPEFYHRDVAPHSRGRFDVVYRCGGHWDVYGSFRDRDDAERAAHRLEHRGYDARIRRVDC
jgi:hypothetical protein